MSEEEILEKLREAVLTADEKLLMEAVKAASETGIDPVRAIKEGLSPPMKELGEKMDRGEVFLSQVLLSGLMMEKGFVEFMKRIPAAEQAAIRYGTLIIGTVRGDIHDIGKKMVSAMLRAAGFKVIDIGIDVPTIKFIEEAQKTSADIIAMSSLLTVSRPFLREVIKTLEDLGLRNQFKVMVGGGAVTEDYAEEIGADGYAKDMTQAVEVAKKLMRPSGMEA